MIITVLTFFANVFIIGSILYMYQVIFGPIDHPSDESDGPLSCAY